MQVTIWGCRGSLPTPMPKAEYEAKLNASLVAYREAGSPEVVDTYLAGLDFVDRSTYGGNTSCVEVTEGDSQLIFDAGSGIRPLGLTMMGGPSGKGQGDVHILFSHTHWDHIMGFPFFVPSFIPGNKINFYGCHDGLKERMEYQHAFTHFPVDMNMMASTKAFTEIQAGDSITIGPFRIKTIKQHHPGDSFGYRVETPSGVFVYATDAEYTEVEWDERQQYIEFFRDADVVIYDAAYSLVEAVEKLDWGHSSPFIGAEMANDANVKKLVLFHHDPTSREAAVTEALAKARRFYEQMPTKSSDVDIVTAHDNMILDIPAED